MHRKFWIDRWSDGNIGFHRDQPMPSLVDHWPALQLPPGSRVLVPLAGKSLDMIWLASRGFRVLGVELSPLAVEQFLADNGLVAVQHDSSMGTHHVAGNIELICGDVFALEDAILETCDAIYDRAAIIALPVEMRKRYVETVYERLRSGCRGLMVTLDYDQSEMDGPPFSVSAEEIDALLGRRWQVEQKDRSSILDSQPRFREQGVTRLHTAAYELHRR